jgi:hypothetical protein
VPTKRAAVPHDYSQEIEKIHVLALYYSRWFQEYPEIQSEYFKNALSDPDLVSVEAKVEFMRDLRDERLLRLDDQIPRLEDIVGNLEKSVQKLENIVASHY